MSQAHPLNISLMTILGIVMHVTIHRIPASSLHRLQFNGSNLTTNDSVFLLCKSMKELTFPAQFTSSMTVPGFCEQTRRGLAICILGVRTQNFDNPNPRRDRSLHRQDFSPPCCLDELVPSDVSFACLSSFQNGACFIHESQKEEKKPKVKIGPLFFPPEADLCTHDFRLLWRMRTSFLCIHFTWR
jgi:hypothetical protein